MPGAARCPVELLSHAEGIDKPTLTNASPLPIHFDPRPPGIRWRRCRRRCSGSNRRRRVRARDPRSRRLLAGDAPRASPAHAQVTSRELTAMYLDRLKRYNPQLNCVASLTEEARDGRSRGRRQGDRGRQVPRRAARHSIRRERHHRRQGLSDPVGREAAGRQTFDEDATVVRRLNEAGAVLSPSSPRASWRSAISGRAAARTIPGIRRRDRADRRPARARRPPRVSSASRSAPIPAARFSRRLAAAASSACDPRSAGSAASAS